MRLFDRRRDRFFCKGQLPTGGFRMKISHRIFAGVSLLALSCLPALAQQITGVPGSPGATTTIDGKQLPPPDPKFGGVVKEKATESTPWWPPRDVPPKGAPNVLLIMTADPGAGSHRQERAALHQLPLDLALLADAGGAHHRTQPPFSGLRGGRRDSN